MTLSCTTNESDPCAAAGASEKVMQAKKLSLKELEACAAENGRKLLTTFPEMRLAFLQECGKRRMNRAFALRDYYPFWKTNDERSKAGKLLLLNRRDQEHIQIMFDDNIGYGSPHIVDARDAETGQPVSFQVSMHACHVFCCASSNVSSALMYLYNITPAVMYPRFHCLLQQAYMKVALLRLQGL